MSFSDKCYALLQKVPKGKVTTYKALAEALNTKAYRAVGMVMKSNPNAPRVPCHRVVGSNGSMTGYQGKENIQTKISLLKSEGVEVNNNKVDLEKYMFNFK